MPPPQRNHSPKPAKGPRITVLYSARGTVRNDDDSTRLGESSATRILERTTIRKVSDSRSRTIIGRKLQTRQSVLLQQRLSSTDNCDSSGSTNTVNSNNNFQEFTTTVHKRTSAAAATRCCPKTVALVVFVFLSCVVPLSTPSSSPTTSSSSSSSSPPPPPLFSHDSGEDQTGGGAGAENEELCASAKKWISTKGSFCFTLRESPFLKNVSELQRREKRAIQMFCDMDRILEKVDCAQPYSVNVNRRQCWLCREAYRDWACAMTTDTVEEGDVDCGRSVMPCPSCASICHQVMRLCPYLTPDRVQLDDEGDPNSHVSQYGGHPAFYCPLENFHATDPAYRIGNCEEEPGSDDDDHEDVDYVHNLCADPSTAFSKRSLYDEYSPAFKYRRYSTCCWTYQSSLLHLSASFEHAVAHAGETRNRVILNCCDEDGVCEGSDPEILLSGNETTTASEVTEEVVPPPSTTRTANNQVLGEDGKFRELNSRYSYLVQHDDDDEEYADYAEDDSSSTAGSLEQLYESSSVIRTTSRDNKRAYRSVERGDLSFYYYETQRASSSSSSSLLYSWVVVVPPVITVLLVSSSFSQLVLVVSCLVVNVVCSSISNTVEWFGYLLVVILIMSVVVDALFVDHLHYGFLPDLLLLQSCCCCCCCYCWNKFRGGRSGGRQHNTIQPHNSIIRITSIYITGSTTTITQDSLWWTNNNYSNYLVLLMMRSFIGGGALRRKPSRCCYSVIACSSPHPLSS